MQSGLRSAEVKQFLAARSFTKAIVIDLPRGYSHELLYFPALLSLKDELPQACGSYVTDLSMKRNVGLVLARMLRWRRIFFLDDDIRDITYPDLQSTVNMLGSFPAVGMWVTDFPDNSIVCHANRMTEGSQDVFVSGAALAVDCDADIGFFPDIYNEDWLFFFDDASAGRLANSCLKATQLRYYPFANPRRAAWQEFGDVLAEGLYALLHLGLGRSRRRANTGLISSRRAGISSRRSTRARTTHIRIYETICCSRYRARSNARSRSSLTCASGTSSCGVKTWRTGNGALAAIPQMPSIDAALREMRLSPPTQRGSTVKIRHRRDEAAENITAGPVMIPRFDTLKELSEHAGILRLSSAAPAAEERDTKPFPVLTSEVSAAILAARTSGHDSTSPGDDEPGRHRKQRFGITMPRLGSIRDARPLRRASALFGAPPGELEPVGCSESADPEPGTTACS